MSPYNSKNFKIPLKYPGSKLRGAQGYVTPPYLPPKGGHRGGTLSETKKEENEKSIRIIYKIWPGLGEAVCTISQASRGVILEF